MKPLPACSQINSEQSDVLFWYLDWIYVMRSKPEENNVTMTWNVARGQTGSTGRNDIANGEEIP